jgi:exopolyphosphatase/guanosine-5'-triphosphate,3'-diphosphate pyrophosphatase
MRLAVLDLGTNTFHLLLAEIHEKNFTILKREKVAVKIGEKGISMGIINREAQQRALRAINYFMFIINEYKVDKIRAIGTSAFRNAHNRTELVQVIESIIGTKVEIISGDKEAYYIFKGVCLAVDLKNYKALIMDIGGGSVEFMVSIFGDCVWKASFEIGGQRLMDNFHQIDPIPLENVLALNNYLDTCLSPLSSEIEKFNPTVLIGSSGSFDTLVEIYKKTTQPDFFIESVSNAVLPKAAFLSIYENLLPLTRNQRMLIPGMIELRVDMIVVACIVINWVLKKVDSNDIIVSTFSLKEGVLSEEIEKLCFDMQNKTI